MSNITIENLQFEWPTNLPTIEAHECVPGEKVVHDDVPSDIFKQFPYIGDPKGYPSWEVAIKIVFYIIPMSVGIIGNGMVIFIVVWNKKMRSVTNIYIANLAVSDMIVSGWCMWIHLGKNISAEWPFGSFFCRIYVFLQGWAATASIFFLTVISGDRFFAIVFPLHARLTYCRAAIGIIAVWQLSALVNLPWLFVFELRVVEWKDYTEVFCDEDWAKYWYLTEDGRCWSHAPGHKSYVTVNVVLLYFVPVFVMIFAYVVIAMKLWKRKLPGEQTDKTQLIQQKGRKKVIRMLVWVLTAFIICWTPYHALNLWGVWRDVAKDLPVWLDDLRYAIRYIAYFNSALNPLLYAGLNENFRSGYKEVFKCKFKKNAVVPLEVHTAWGQGTKTNGNMKNTALAPSERSQKFQK